MSRHGDVLGFAQWVVGGLVIGAGLGAFFTGSQLEMDYVSGVVSILAGLLLWQAGWDTR